MTAEPPQLQQVISFLQSGGLEVESVEGGLLVQAGESQVALFLDSDSQGGLLARLHLDLELFVEEESLPEILMGMNLMNQGLDYGALILDPLEAEDGEEVTLFAVLGRTTLWLPDLGVGELARLQEHLLRFESEITAAVEQALHGGSGLSA